MSVPLGRHVWLGRIVVEHEPRLQRYLVRALRAEADGRMVPAGLEERVERLDNAYLARVAREVFGCTGRLRKGAGGWEVWRAPAPAAPAPAPRAPAQRAPRAAAGGTTPGAMPPGFFEPYDPNSAPPPAGRGRRGR